MEVNQMKEVRVIGGVLGVIIGDIVGLPVQFLTRSTVKKNPVEDIRTWEEGLPKGIFSDDGSLTLCLVDSMVNVGYDLNDLARRFLKWYQEGYMTSYGEAFDIGGTTSVAMDRLIEGVSPLRAGPAEGRDNGNGSLMRILPAALYFAHLPDTELIKRVCEVSKITHGHPRSLLGCCIYAIMAKRLFAGDTPYEAYQCLQRTAPELFKETVMKDELKHYHRILDGRLPELQEDEISSSGYVVHTLEAAMWAFLTTKNFKEAILKVVNLGDDSDTTGAVCGGLAGIYYGKHGIPEDWIRTMVKRDKIIPLVEKFAKIVVDLN
jgi:ADP-ribosylglycohydrolase